MKHGSTIYECAKAQTHLYKMFAQGGQSLC